MLLLLLYFKLELHCFSLDVHLSLLVLNSKIILELSFQLLQDLIHALTMLFQLLILSLQLIILGELDASLQELHLVEQLHAVLAHSLQLFLALHVKLIIHSGLALELVNAVNQLFI